MILTERNHLSKRHTNKVGSHHSYVKAARKAAAQIGKLPGIKAIIPLKIVPAGRPLAVRVQRSLPGALRLFVTSPEGCQELLVMLESDSDTVSLAAQITAINP